MDIYEMLEKGMTIDEIKSEVDKAAALYKEDQESEKEELLNYAKEDLRDSIINFLEATGEVDPETLKDEKFKETVEKTINDFKDQLTAFNKLTKLFQEDQPKTVKVESRDLKDLARLFF